MLSSYSDEMYWVKAPTVQASLFQVADSDHFHSGRPRSAIMSPIEPETQMFGSNSPEPMASDSFCVSGAMSR